MRRFWLFLPLGVFSALMFACGGCGSNSGGGDSVTAIQINTVNATGVAIPSTPTLLPRGESVTFSLTQRLSSGGTSTVYSNTVRWETSDPSFVIAPSGDYITVTPTKDWFDAANTEPTATITAHYENLTTTTRIQSVINANGRWTATAAGSTQKLSLTQHGRTITDAKTGISGTIDGNKLVINNTLFVVDAHFDTRERAVGTFSGSGVNGDFTCTKDQ